MNKQKVDSLRAFFEAAELPKSPIRLDGNTVIESPADFVVGHLEYVEANFANRTAQPYYERLVKLRQIIEGNG